MSGIDPYRRSDIERYGRLAVRAATLAGRIEGWLYYQQQGTATAEQALAGIRQALVTFDALDNYEVACDPCPGRVLLASLAPAEPADEAPPVAAPAGLVDAGMSAGSTR